MFREISVLILGSVRTLRRELQFGPDLSYRFQGNRFTRTFEIINLFIYKHCHKVAKKEIPQSFLLHYEVPKNK